MERLVVEPDQNYYVSESTIPNSGYGLFAKVPLKAGTRLIYQGVLVEKNSTTDLCTKYARDYKINLNDQFCFIPMGFAAMANHTKDGPNAKLAMTESSLALEMLRDIEKDEEILFCYGDSIDLKFDLISKGTAFAVVRVNEDESKILVKRVYLSLSRAIEEALKLNCDGWRAFFQPCQIDMSDFEGRTK